MKHSVLLIPGLLLGSTILAAPAAAEAIHRTSVDHRGRTVSVSYAPVARTSLKQAGIGPRTSAACRWRTEVSVERTVADASGRPIVVLTRVVEESKVRSGMHVGHCSSLAGEVASAAAERELPAFVTAVADADAAALRTELASLGVLLTADAR